MPPTTARRNSGRHAANRRRSGLPRFDVLHKVDKPVNGVNLHFLAQAVTCLIVTFNGNSERRRRLARRHVHTYEAEYEHVIVGKLRKTLFNIAQERGMLGIERRLEHVDTCPRVFPSVRHGDLFQHVLIVVALPCQLVLHLLHFQCQQFVFKALVLYVLVQPAPLGRFSPQLQLALLVQQEHYDAQCGDAQSQAEQQDVTLLMLFLRLHQGEVVLVALLYHGYVAQNLRPALSPCSSNATIAR